MLKAKSNEKSDEFKDDGNIFYKRFEFYNSLMSYNKSLCFAESKENQALAYGNRSAVYFELKKYEECLKNIQWARESYPADKIQKLNEREEKCKKMKEEQLIDPIDDPWDYFKLSYPANPKIPFLIDGIEKRSDGIYTTKDLKAGDVIAIEDFCFQRLFCPGQYNRCCCCVKVNMMNLIPCTKTASLMFCSEDCRNKIYKAYGEGNMDTMLVYGEMFIDGDRTIREIEAAFGGHEKLIKFLTGNDLTKLNKTIFDYIWNDKNHPKYNENLMKCFFSLRVNELRPPFILFPLLPPTLNFTKGKAEIIDLAQNIFNVVNSRATFIEYHDYKFAEQVCPEAVHDGLAVTCLLFNHSCMKNVTTIMVDNKVATIVLKPIKAGEQLFLNYVPIFHYFNSIRQMRIPANLNCDCFACENDLKPTDFKITDPRVIENATENAEIAFRNVKKMKDALKNNWSYISAHSNDLFSLEVPHLMQINCAILVNLAYTASFPC